MQANSGYGLGQVGNIQIQSFHDNPTNNNNNGDGIMLIIFFFCCWQYIAYKLPLMGQ